ncbi:MAG: DUF5329 domain-containing protein [Betaproteobacteria bacterium]|nr:DUF5329 domain-containing protein [Betaproteobacteria bacterium]
MTRLFAAAILAAAVCGSVHAGDLSSQARAEVDYLFSWLKNSGCQFNRNGKWYSAEEAVSHLDRKLQYLLDKNMLSSTEDFIDKAATGSSMSGKPYLVKCGNEAPVQSESWFRTGLSRYRSEKH